MMRKAIALAVALIGSALLASPARAQYTTVTGTVQDPNGIPYGYATIKAQMVATSGQGPFTLTITNQAQCSSAGAGTAPCQVPFTQNIGPTFLSASGAFSITVADNSQVTSSTSAVTQWLFTVSETPGIPAPLGVGPVTFTYQATISGSSQSITSGLNAAAVALTTVAIGGGSGSPCTTTASSLQYDNAGAFGCVAQFTYASSAVSIASGGTLNVNNGAAISDNSGGAITGFSGSLFDGTFTDANNPLVITWHLTTTNLVGLTIGESGGASTGTNVDLMEVVTATGSTAIPLIVENQLSGTQTLPALELTPIWNTSGVVDAAFKINATNTASGAGSLLADFQIGGTSEWSADKAGNVVQNGNLTITPLAGGGTQCLDVNNSGVVGVTGSACGSGGSTALSSLTAATGTNTINNGANAQIWEWTFSTANAGLEFTEAAASTGVGAVLLKSATLGGSTAIPAEFGNALTGSQTLPALEIAPVWNTTGVVDAALLIDASNTASGTGSLLADFQIANTSEWKVDKAGNSTQQGSVTVVSSTLAGLLSLAGNTTNPTLPSNSIGFLGPTSASFTSYFLQFPTTAPSSNFLQCGAPSSNVSTCTWASGGGGSSALSAITAATGANTIASGNNVAQIWNWAMTSNGVTAFTFGETSAATGTGTNYILKAVTLAGSTASPLNVTDSLSGSQTLCALCVTPTWNTTGVVDAGILENVTNTASGTGSLLADFQVGGTSEWKVDKAGNSTQTGGATATSVTTNGSGAGYFQCGNGTAPSLVTGTFQLTCPSGSITNYQLVVPTGVLATGTLQVTASGNVDTLSSYSNGTLTIANGTAALGTSLISSGTCATVVTVTATGTATTDNIEADFNADPTSTTGYSPSASGMLTIIKYPTSNNVNFKVCNNTGAGITPGAITLNWRVVR